MENPDADVNSEAPAAREIKQSGRALISAALVPLDRLGNLDGDMRPLLGRPFKCSACGCRGPWRNAVSSATAATRRTASPCFLACAKATSSNRRCRHHASSRGQTPCLVSRTPTPQPAGDESKIATLDERRERNAGD